MRFPPFEMQQKQNHQQDMAYTLTCKFLVLFISCGLRLAFGVEKSALAPAPASGGICSLRVTIFGYACEEHLVTTQDGYILSMQRIPVGRSGDMTGGRPPVLLQHGLLMDGITWLVNDPEQSLAYILADNGFDVWIANGRGTRYSLGHTSLNSGDSAYWEWSWDELASFDLPTTLQYVHDQTGQKLHYAAHSLGTLLALASFSQQKQLDLFRSAALLSPIAYVSQISSVLARAGADSFLAEDLYWLGIHEFDPNGQAAANLLKDICNTPGANCYDLQTAFTGPNCCCNASNANVFLQNEPQPTSTKNLIHIAQMVRGGGITMFDYGNADDNMNHYGKSTPPVYNMSSIPNNVPLFLSYGGKDALSDVNDVQILLGDLKDHDQDELLVQYQPDYAHADFVFGSNAKQLVYNDMIAFFQRH